MYTRALNSDPSRSAWGPWPAKERPNMNWKAKLVLGILTASAMSALTLTLPRGTALQSAVMVTFPMTVGVWAIFVLLFVRLK